jgi:hypothetical protein
MGYWDGITRSGFVELEDGRVAYFPFGVFGKGRIITRERAADVQRIQVRMLAPALVIIALAGSVSWWILFLSLPFLTWHVLWTATAFADCEVVQGRRLGLLENARNMAASMGLWTVSGLADHETGRDSVRSHHGRGNRSLFRFWTLDVL